jgi:hypothetical protein
MSEKNSNQTNNQSASRENEAPRDTLHSVAKELFVLVEKHYETTGDPSLKNIVARARVVLQRDARK